MGTKTSTAITTVKQELRLGEWTEQIKAQQESGMTVSSDTSWNRKCKKFRKRLDLSDRLWYPVGSTIGLA